MIETLLLSPSSFFSSSQRQSLKIVRRHRKARTHVASLIPEKKRKRKKGDSPGIARQREADEMGGGGGAGFANIHFSVLKH